MELNKFLAVIFIGVIIIGCGNSQNSSKVQFENVKIKTPIIDGSLTIQEPIIKGESYSDSIIEKLIKGSLPKRKIEIDTAETLAGISCDIIPRIKSYDFTMDTIRKYEDILQAIDTNVEEVLEVTNCFSKFSKTEKFTSYIFFSQLKESHYSGSFELVTIQEKSNAINKIILANEYGNELGDQSISTTITNDMNFVRSINYNLRNIHGVGEVDSSFVKKEYYNISNDGTFKLIKTVFEK